MNTNTTVRTRMEKVKTNQFIIWTDQRGDIWRAICWNCLRKNEWMVLSRDTRGARWHPGDGENPNDKQYDLNENGKAVILIRFGLYTKAKELSLEEIKYMSPRLLMEMRRGIEGTDFGEQEYIVTSECAGDPLRAEDCS